MSIKRILQICAIAAAVPLTASAVAAEDKLATAKTIQCTFPLIANATWKNGKPEATVKPATLNMKFIAINADEGSAQLEGGSGTYDIIVKYASGYLNFIQAFRDGPVYTTTIFQKESTPGKLKAVHSRHELFDFPLPGFTSSPEQYYGECEIKE
jgi:hypothetical protein